MQIRLTTLALALLAGTCACSSNIPSEGSSSTAAALTTPGLFFQGDNFSGAERGFGAAIEEPYGPAIPGVEGQTYSWPLPAGSELPTGMNIVRLPFQWERLQPTLNGDFDPGYLAKLHETAEAWRKVGATVLLDVHNYSYYKVSGRGTAQPGQHIGSAEVPIAAFGDLWRRLAVEFGSASTSSPFVFGLMNEPHDIAVSVWVDAAQQAVNAIRATGAKNPVFVPGADWTTAADFAWSDNAKLLQAVTDPGNNFAIEVHQYYDGICVPSSFLDKLKPFEDWAVANGRLAFIGETDLTDSTAACQEAFTNLIAHLRAKAAGTSGGVWVGYTYWEGKGLSTALPLIQPNLPASCANSLKDGLETDVDCGSTCRRCADGRSCANAYDCQSGFCTNGACSATGGATAGSGGAAGAGGAVIGTAGSGGAAGAGGAAIGAGGSSANAAGQPTTGGAVGQGGAGGSTAGGQTPAAGATSNVASSDGAGCGCQLAHRAPSWPLAAALAALLWLPTRRRRARPARRACGRQPLARRDAGSCD